MNDALMTAMGAPWLNTKLVVAVNRVNRVGISVGHQCGMRAVQTGCETAPLPAKRLRLLN